MYVKVLESAMVVPANDTPRHRLWVSDIDLMVEDYVKTTYFFRRQVNSSPDFFDAHKLRASLSQILVTFYLAAGRLARDTNNRIEISCNGEGALFVLAETETAIDDEFLELQPSEKLKQLVPLVDPTQDISSYPLFLVQVTHFKCGGVSLGIELHHILADGSSGMQLINSWAALTRGQSITLEPFIDRTLLRPRDPPTPSFPHIEYQQAPVLVNENDYPLDSSLSNGPLASECLNITPDLLDRLKDKAPRYTRFEVITAHVWRCVCKARSLADHQDSRLSIPVDGRLRFQPPLPPGYFGNTQFMARPIAMVRDIIGRPLEHTASLIHEAVARIDDEYIKSALDHLALQPDIEDLRVGRRFVKIPNLHVVSWLRLAFHEADFGWGRPAFMGLFPVGYDGRARLVPSTIGDGSLILLISLQLQHMVAFKSLFYEI